MHPLIAEPQSHKSLRPILQNAPKAPTGPTIKLQNQLITFITCYYPLMIWSHKDKALANNQKTRTLAALANHHWINQKPQLHCSTNPSKSSTFNMETMKKHGKKPTNHTSQKISYYEIKPTYQLPATLPYLTTTGCPATAAASKDRPHSAL